MNTLPLCQHEYLPRWVVSIIDKTLTLYGAPNEYYATLLAKLYYNYWDNPKILWTASIFDKNGKETFLTYKGLKRKFSSSQEARIAVEKKLKITEVENETWVKFSNCYPFGVYVKH